MYKWKCPICGKGLKDFNFQEFSRCRITIVFGKFKIRDENGKIKKTDRKTIPVCSDQCKQKNENQYLVEKYKGIKIFRVNKRYMNRLDDEASYDNIEDVRRRIDNENDYGNCNISDNS